jgi:DnaD domain protein
MYIKKNLSQHDVERVAYMYESLGMSADLIEYMVESCVEKGKTSLRYMEKIAIDWYEKGIDSIEKAKTTANIYPKEVWEIMKAFGISSRLPGSGEVSYMNKWLQEYAFSIDVIKEACDRTLLNAQKPSFHYADSILSRWYKLGIKSIDEIGLKDIKKDRIKTVETQRPRQTAKLNNRFINFEQRDDSEEDLNNLINERLRQRLGQGKLRGSLDGVK